MNATKVKTAGWAWLLNSGLYHFFKPNGESLCGDWTFRTFIGVEKPPDALCCKACLQKRKIQP